MYIDLEDFKQVNIAAGYLEQQTRALPGASL